MPYLDPEKRRACNEQARLRYELSEKGQATRREQMLAKRGSLTPRTKIRPGQDDSKLWAGVDYTGR